MQIISSRSTPQLITSGGWTAHRQTETANSFMASRPRLLPLTLTRFKKKKGATSRSSIAHLIFICCVVGLHLQQEEHSKVGDVDMKMNYSVQSINQLHHRILSDLGDTAVRLEMQFSFQKKSFKHHLQYSFFLFGVPLLPEALCLLCEGSWVPSIGWLIQLGQQSLAGLLARVVCKLDCNGFGGARRLLAVQALDGFFGLNSPIETNEANPSGNAWGGESRKHPAWTSLTRLKHSLRVKILHLVGWVYRWNI